MPDASVNAAIISNERFILQVASQQATGFAALFLVVLLAQNLLHPAVNLLAIFTFEPDLLAGV